MFVMSAKVNKKKIILALAAAAALIVALFMLFGNADTTPTLSGGMATNDSRVQFLKDLGWEVAASPTQSGQVRIPEESSEVFDRYNALQKSQGYDLSQFAGKSVMRYVYKVSNYPGATDPVYATLLVYKDQVIGGDITDSSAKGVIQGLKKATDKAASAASAPIQDAQEDPQP